MSKRKNTKARLISLLLVAVMLIGMIPAGVVTVTADGAITPDTSWFDDYPSKTEYEISTPAQLLGFGAIMYRNTAESKFLNKTVKLTADIDLNPTWTASSSQPTNVWKTGTFQGTFDGQGHTISGIWANKNSVPGGGGRVGFVRNMEGATIENVAIVNSYFIGTSGQSAGSIAGSATNNDGTTAPTDYDIIRNVYSEAIVEASGNNGGTGGLVGTVGNPYNGVEIYDSVFAGTVTAGNYTAGILGTGNGKKVIIENCVNMGTVNGADSVAGIMGSNNGETTTSELKCCINLGKINATGISGDLFCLGASSTCTMTSCFWVGGSTFASAYSTSGGTVSGSATETTLDNLRTAASGLSDYSTTYGNKVMLPSALLSAFEGKNTALGKISEKVTSFEANYVPVKFNLLPTGVTVDANRESYAGPNGSMVFYYTEADTSDYNNYLTAISGAGYTKINDYSSDSEQNLYSLWQNGTFTIYVSFLHSASGNSNGRIRVSVSFKTSSVHNINKTAVSVEKVCEASLWQLNVDTNSDNGGMSYVIRLENGKFVIIDGGYETQIEADNLYAVLSQNNVLSGKPVVEAWFITHGHSDHYGGLKKFAPVYGSRVTVESFYYNFPSYHVEDTDVWPNNQANVINACKSAWPTAVHYSEIHSGMTMGLSNATVEVLATHEDVFHSYYKSSNGSTLTANNFNGGGGDDTSTVLRFTVGGKTILFFGDSETNMSEVLASTYSDAYMKSDYVQLTGHGYDIIQGDYIANMCARALKSEGGSVLLVPSDVIYVNGDGVLGLQGGNQTNVWQGNMSHLHGQSTSYSAAGDVYVAYENREFVLTGANAYTVSGHKESKAELNKVADEKMAVYNAAAGKNGAGGVIKYQVATTTKEAVRFIGVLELSEGDFADFESFGFTIGYRVNGGSKAGNYVETITTTMLYTSILAAGETVTAEDLGGEYVYALAVDGLYEFTGAESIDFVVTGFGVTIDGTRVNYGGRTCTVTFS